jgi:hypothetical protein
VATVGDAVVFLERGSKPIIASLTTVPPDGGRTDRKEPHP